MNELMEVGVSINSEWVSFSCKTCPEAATVAVLTYDHAPVALRVKCKKCGRQTDLKIVQSHLEGPSN